jgi:hypothetical protein
MITVLMHRRQTNHLDDDLTLLPVIWFFIKLLIYKRITQYQALYFHDIPEKYRGPEVIPGGKSYLTLLKNGNIFPIKALMPISESFS